MQDPRSSQPLSSSLATDRLTVVVVCSILLAFMFLSLVIFFYACKCVEARNRRHRQVQEGQGQGQEQEQLQQRGATIQSRLGLSKDLVKGLPVVSYEQLVRIKCGEENVECCAVCLIEFGREDKKIRHLPRCGHCFHTDCIDMWFFSHSSCPICRDSLQDHQKEPLLELVIPSSA